MMRARTTLMACAFGIAGACASPSVPPPAAQADSVVSGTIGIVVQRGSAGIVVASVGKDGPAAAAGLRAGDVVLRYNGVSISDTGQFYRLMLDTAPGSTAVVEVLREGAARRFDVPVRQIDTAARA